MSALDTAMQKIEWGSRSDFSVDLNREECDAILADLSKHDTCARCQCTVIPSRRPTLCVDCAPFYDEAKAVAE